MKKSSISHTKNALSALLEEVKRGETIVITDRRRPIATIERYAPNFDGVAADMEDLVRSGVITPPRRSLDAEAFFSSESPRLPDGVSAASLIVAEREEGR